MYTLVDRDEALWGECDRIAADNAVVSSLIGASVGIEPEVLLAYAPVARRNQFQVMLYSQARSQRFRLMPLTRLSLLPRVPWVGPVVSHLHWLHEGTSKAQGLEEADNAVLAFDSLLHQIKRAGHQIVWTVHNVLPHDSRWPEHDAKIHQLMADAADVVHVMSQQSRVICAPHYQWAAEKELFVPHPSYAGAHADWIGRPQARADFRIQDDEFVFLSFGAVLPYKGYANLMNAFDAAQRVSCRPLRLVIAGAPAHEELAESLRAWAHGHSNVTLELRTIASDEIQTYFRAADVAVCPYARTLNSGAALMAASFGLPVIGPRVGGFVDNVGEAAAFLYDPQREGALLDTMLQATQEDLLPKSRAASIVAASLAAESVSTALFKGLRERLSFPSIKGK